MLDKDRIGENSKNNWQNNWGQNNWGNWGQMNISLINNSTPSF